MERDSAISSVISEVLLIALVLILVPIVTVSLMNQLPDDRVPTVTIMMGSLDDLNITLFHKGGDWIRTEDIRIQVNGEIIDSWRATYPSNTFDLSDRIIVTGIPEGGTIRVIAKNAVIFSGVAHP